MFRIIEFRPENDYSMVMNHIYKETFNLDDYKQVMYDYFEKNDGCDQISAFRFISDAIKLRCK